jgi:hypothetical protein
MHRTAAARAVLVLDIDDDRDPRQMQRQGATGAPRRLALAAHLLVGCRSSLDNRLGEPQRLCDLFQRELQLSRGRSSPSARRSGCASAP